MSTPKPDKILSARAIGFPEPETLPYHVPDWSARHESGLPVCKRCGLPVTGEQWVKEICSGRKS